MELTAPVFNIQRFCTHDGNGIRTTVFLKGCNMRCEWCANPESQEAEPQMMFYEHKCTGCRNCIEECPKQSVSFQNGRIVQNWDLCINCGACAERCYSGARALLGKTMNVDQVFQEIQKDKVFFDTSGGGVTFSGGEPLLYGDFVFDVAKRCKEEGINVAVETCGCFLQESVESVACIDTMLFDLKLIDDDKHHRYCGCTNKKILSNFRRACQLTDILPRIPVIPGVNDTKNDIQLLTDFLNTCEAEFERLCLLPYHNLGQCKYEGLGRDYTMKDITPPESDYMMRVKEDFESLGYQVKIGG